MGGLLNSELDQILQPDLEDPQQILLTRLLSSTILLTKLLGLLSMTQVTLQEWGAWLMFHLSLGVFLLEQSRSMRTPLL